MSTQTIDTAPRAAVLPGARAAGAATLAAAAITVFGGLSHQLTSSTVPDALWRAPFSAGAFVVVCLTAAASHALLACGLAWLRGSALTGTSRAVRGGLAAAITALVVMTACELAGLAISGQADDATVPTIVGVGFGITSFAFLVGATLAGRAAARDGAWRDARRVLLLATGLAIAPLVILGPTDLFGWGLVLWGLPMAALGAALTRPGPYPSRST